MICLEQLAKVLEDIEVTASASKGMSYEAVCEKLIELATIKDRIQADIDILKDSLEENSMTRLPFKNDDGEIVVESKTSYDFDIKAIKKELPEEVFIECVSITKSHIKDAVTETDAVKKKELVKVYTAVVEKHQTRRDGREYVKVTAYKKEQKPTGIVRVK
jgi:hypothetical protein